MSQEAGELDPRRPISPVRAVLRGLLRSAVGLLLLLGWTAAFLLASTRVAERLGWIRFPLEAALRAGLGPLADELRVAGIDVRWRGRELSLRGVALGTEGAEAQLERIDLRVGWREPFGLVVERVAVEGGYVCITPRLVEMLRALREQDYRADLPIPVVVVRDVDLGLAVAGSHMQALGRLEALAEPGAGGKHVLRGRLRSLSSARSDSVGELFLFGELQTDGSATVRSTARGFPLSTATLATSTLGGAFDGLDARGTIDVDASLSLESGLHALPSLALRLRVHDADLRLPHLEGADPADRLSVPSFSVEAEFDGGRAAQGGLLSVEAWRAKLEAEARWRSIEARVEGLVGAGDGGPGGVSVWASLPAVPVDDQTLRLAGRPHFLVEEVWNRVEPRGHAALSAAARLLPGADPFAAVRSGSIAGAVDAWEILVDVDPGGSVSAAYHGPHSERGVRDQGFPLRLEDVQGRVVFAWSPGQRYSEELALHALVGRHAGGTAHIDGSLHVIPGEPGRQSGLEWAATDFWLRARSERLPIDGTLERAFDGLAGVIPPEELWQEYRPAGGELGFLLQLWLTPTNPELAAQVSVDLRRARISIRSLPLPLRSVQGQLDIAVDGRPRGEGGGGFGLGLDLSARIDAAPDPLSIRGRLVRSGRESMGAAREDWKVEAASLDLEDGELRAALEWLAPEVVELAREARLRGNAALSLARTRERVGGASVMRLDLRPGLGASLVPPGTDLRLEGLGGRVLARIETAPAEEAGSKPLIEARLAPAQGFWEEQGPRIPFLAGGVLDATGRLSLDLRGGALPLHDEGLLRRLGTLAGRAVDAPEAGAGTRLAGVVDFRILLDSEPPVADAPRRIEARIELHPRSVAIGTAGAEFLDGLEGKLEFADGRLRGPRLRAVLGRTPFELRNLEVELGESGGRGRTDVTLDDLPLDAAHLEHLLPGELLRSLIDDLDWRGVVDVENGHLTAEWSDTDPPLISFRGDLRVSDLFARLGLPLSVRSALAPGLELIWEEGSLRAWSQVHELYAQMDGRRLDDASMVVSFVQPRLTVERFDGRFEGGRLSSLGRASGAGSGGFLSLDLEPPYPFGLSIEAADLDLEGLLRGMFNSDFANQGVLRGSLRLNGDTEDIANMRGEGFVEMAETSLWSIPVFQALFSQLGFDSTAVFDRMRCSFRVEDGVIRMRNMRAESPLLRLVGEGEVGFDGSLDHALEVRYALVDQLGPFTRLLYWVQRSLLRIAIGGDMERPKVALKGILPSFFDFARSERQLPVPSFSPLPARF